jgi:hypothetical protein
MLAAIGFRSNNRGCPSGASCEGGGSDPLSTRPRRLTGQEAPWRGATAGPIEPLSSAPKRSQVHSSAPCPGQLTQRDSFASRRKRSVFCFPEVPFRIPLGSPSSSTGYLTRLVVRARQRARKLAIRFEVGPSGPKQPDWVANTGLISQSSTSVTSSSHVSSHDRGLTARSWARGRARNSGPNLVVAGSSEGSWRGGPRHSQVRMLRDHDLIGEATREAERSMPAQRRILRQA